MCTLYSSYGDVCQAKSNVITLTLTETDCTVDNAGATTYTMKNCVITQVGLAVAAQDMILRLRTFYFAGRQSINSL